MSNDIEFPEQPDSVNMLDSYGDDDDFSFGFDLDEFVVKLDGVYLAEFGGYEKVIDQNDPNKCRHVFKFTIKDTEKNDGQAFGKLVSSMMFLPVRMTKELYAQLPTSPKNMKMAFDINAKNLQDTIRQLEIPKGSNPNIRRGDMFKIHVINNEQTGYDEIKRIEAIKADNDINQAMNG